VTVSWFGPQNQVGFDLSVASQNRRREVDAGHALRSSGLLHVNASLIRVSQSSLNIDGGATTGDAREHHRGGCVGGKLKTDRSM
jgi:hypothetical protein